MHFTDYVLKSIQWTIISFNFQSHADLIK